MHLFSQSSYGGDWCKKNNPRDHIKETGEFVVGILTPEIAEKVFRAGDKEKGDDEFEYCEPTPCLSRR